MSLIIIQVSIIYDFFLSCCRYLLKTNKVLARYMYVLFSNGTPNR